jgi:hypothetical protein
MYAGSADKTKDKTKRDIFENFVKYNLEKPELIRMDNHMFDRHIYVSDKKGDKSSNNTNSSISDRLISDGNAKSSVKVTSSSDSMVVDDDSIKGDGENVDDGCMFDVIVTDPPYGIRAGAKKSGKRKKVEYSISEDKRYVFIHICMYICIHIYMYIYIYTYIYIYIGMIIFLVLNIIQLKKS